METMHIQYSLKKNSAYSIDFKSSILSVRKNVDTFTEDVGIRQGTFTDDVVRQQGRRQTNDETDIKIYTKPTHSNITNKISKSKTKTTIKLNNIFDKHCLETYGEKTCILFELDNDNIEMRLLDNLYPAEPSDSPYQLKYTNRNKLYIIIPSLLEKLYTVVLVQIIKTKETSNEGTLLSNYIVGKSTKEIVAIHFPSK